jgi:HTH-type transcriptional repressor of NAD biosynthesis genes
MKRGLIFGKFYPFHNGHKALITFAEKRCDQLIVLICASDREMISSETRAQWLKLEFDQTPNIHIRVYDYLESELPNTSKSSRDVSAIWSSVFKTILPPIDVVFTSERYGEYVGSYLAVKSVCFDLNRAIVPVSGEEIRKSPSSYWDYLPIPTKRYFQKKLAIVGTESTAKSSVAEALSKQFRSTLVTEAGRELIENSNDFEKSTLSKIAIRHFNSIVEAEKKYEPLIILDTEVITTQSYCKFQYGSILDLKKEIYEANLADSYLYFDKDFPYHQDGTRFYEEDREKLDASHKSTFSEFEVTLNIVRGTWNERLRESVVAANWLLDSMQVSDVSNSFV